MGSHPVSTGEPKHCLPRLPKLPFIRYEPNHHQKPTYDDCLIIIVRKTDCYEILASINTDDKSNVYAAIVIRFTEIHRQNRLHSLLKAVSAHRSAFQRYINVIRVPSGNNPIYPVMRFAKLPSKFRQRLTLTYFTFTIKNSKLGKS